MKLEEQTLETLIQMLKLNISKERELSAELKTLRYAQKSITKEIATRENGRNAAFYAILSFNNKGQE